MILTCSRNGEFFFGVPGLVYPFIDTRLSIAIFRWGANQAGWFQANISMFLKADLQKKSRKL